MKRKNFTSNNPFTALLDQQERKSEEQPKEAENKTIEAKEQPTGKNRGGRPRKAPGDPTQCKKFTAWLPLEALELVKKYSQEQSLSMSQFVTKAVLHEVEAIDHETGTRSLNAKLRKMEQEELDSATTSEEVKEIVSRYEKLIKTKL